MKSIKLFALLTVCAVLWACAPSAQAADCPLPAAGKTCPDDALCVFWGVAVTRQDGGALPAAEWKTVEVSLSGALLGAVPGAALQLIYPIPPGTTYAAGSLLSVVSIDTAGTKSSLPFTCTLAKAVSVPKSPPVAPPGVTVLTGA